VFVLRQAFHFEENAFGFAILDRSEQRRLLQKVPLKPCIFSDDIHITKTYVHGVMCNMPAIAAKVKGTVDSKQDCRYEMILRALHENTIVAAASLQRRQWVEGKNRSNKYMSRLQAIGSDGKLQIQSQTASVQRTQWGSG
jgi:hypothetical protein